MSKWNNFQYKFHMIISEDVQSFQLQYIVRSNEFDI